ncbi:GNAT family N-acetyltransferase, partial [Pseudactinotalea sp.]|uniref:GNAT family N-acetyltransferase n=1 Tax=Pseudactinotalea sp. TaxID=1926260 RepID=UPI003B3B9E8B
MTSNPARTVAETVPLDSASTQSLADRGFDYRIVTTEGEPFERFNAAIGRGFLGERSTPERVQGWRESIDGNRLVGVYDPEGADPETPVGTVNSWVMDVTVDADSFLPMWSISAVTVSSTHRRRGIARALLEGELRAAASAGVPIAGLTVSEATIYGRYGFGVAA